MRRFNFSIKDRKILYLVFSVVLICLFTLTIAYSALSTILSINGNSEVVASSWDIYLSNPSVTNGSVTDDVPTIIGNDTLEFNSILNVPGDFYEFRFDIVNDGSIDAMIDSFVKSPELTDEQKKYLKYEVSYLSGESITEKQLLKKGTKVPVKVRIEYRNDISVSDLPSNATTLDLALRFIYSQSDGTETNIGNGGFGSSVFEGRSALFLGDSVSYGYYTDGNGFGYYIDSLVDLGSYTNAGVSSATLNTKTQGTNNVINQINQNKNNSYDYVIIQGGFGDLRDQHVLGSISTGYNIGELDTTTFAGAVEYTLYLATNYWKNSKIGFIISYYTPNSNQGVRPDFNKSKQYWDIVKAACNKWNVSYLDFFEGSTTYNGEEKTYTEIFDVYNNSYLTDGIHPSVEGYEIIVPFIVDWMQGLSTYSADFEVTKDYVESFTELKFYKDYAIASNSSTVVNWGSPSIGRASAFNQYLKVNGGEKIGLIDNVDVHFAIWELDANRYVTNLGYMHNSWLKDDITLHEDTEYIVVSFRNGDGSTSFTDEQLALLPTYIKFK